MRWERDVPLAGLTRYGIGGPAARLARPGSRAELRRALGELAGRPHLVLGGGANLLVADEGVEAAVLVPGGELAFLRSGPDRLEAGAAARLPGLVQEARRGGRRGWSFLEAVPGTVGGGLRMNAGSRDTWMWHRVRWVDAVTPEGRELRLRREDVEAGYRQVDVDPDWIFVAAAFDAPPGEAGEVEREHLAFRRAKVRAQVYELPTVGSTWKNPGPPHGAAWEVVERVGMRGSRHGDAQISERHANFIVNHGEATAEDVLALMVQTRDRALEELGVALEPEIVLWGFDAERLRRVGAIEAHVASGPASDASNEPAGGAGT